MDNYQKTRNLIYFSPKVIKLNVSQMIKNVINRFKSKKCFAKEVWLTTEEPF